MSPRRYFWVATALALAWPLAGTLRAQTGTSTIAGVVRDTSGAALPGASVRVVNEDTRVSGETLTNGEGIYRVSALVPGRYQVETTLDGFEPTVRRSFTLEVSQAIAVDIVLSVGKQSETVNVTESAPVVVESQSSNITQTVTRQMLEGLPQPNRAASSLAALAPGVVMIDTGSGTAENYPVFSVAGGRARNQNFILDGGNASNAVGLTRPQQLTSLPVDAMQEFKVITNNYSAEFGHSTGGVVVMSTRSGTNDFRGSLFESLRNDALDARNFFAKTKPPIRLTQYSGTIGGPIKTGQTFFFASWERTGQLTSDTVISTVPTLLNRRGDFSDLQGRAGQTIAIYDPVTRQPFSGNTIPENRIDPVALAALQYYPLPNRQGTATNANNFVGNSQATLDRNILLGRVDHQFRRDDLVTVRYYINNSGTNVTGSYGNPGADPLADSTAVRVQSLLVAHTHIFGPGVVNELRVTSLRRKFIDQRPGLGTDLAATIGLRGVTDRAFPAFTVPGYASLSSASVARFQTPILDTQVLESLSWSRGRHAFKFGGEFRAGANDEIRDRGSSGNLSFTPLITSNLGAANTGNALASFLLGEGNAANVQISDLIQTRASYWAFYAQDCHRHLNAVVAGWKVGVLETIQSGPPFTVLTTANTTNAFAAGPLRPNLAGDPELPSDERTLTQWFNTAAFVNPAALTFGTSPRSVLRGPGVVTTDLTLEKRVGLPRHTTFDLRVLREFNSAISNQQSSISNFRNQPSLFPCSSVSSTTVRGPFSSQTAYWTLPYIVTPAC